MLLHQLHEAVCCSLRPCCSALLLCKIPSTAVAGQAAAACAASALLEAPHCLLLCLAAGWSGGLLGVLGLLQDDSECVADTILCLEAEGGP